MGRGKTKEQQDYQQRQVTTILFGAFSRSCAWSQVHVAEVHDVPHELNGRSQQRPVLRPGIHRVAYSSQCYTVTAFVRGNAPPSALVLGWLFRHRVYQPRHAGLMAARLRAHSVHTVGAPPVWQRNAATLQWPAECHLPRVRLHSWYADVSLISLVTLSLFGFSLSHIITYNQKCEYRFKKKSTTIQCTSITFFTQFDFWMKLSDLIQQSVGLINISISDKYAIADLSKS